MTAHVEEQIGEISHPVMLYEGDPVEVLAAFCLWWDDAFIGFLCSLKSKFLFMGAHCLHSSADSLYFLFAGI